MYSATSSGIQTPSSNKQYTPVEVVMHSTFLSPLTAQLLLHCAINCSSIDLFRLYKAKLEGLLRDDTLLRN